MRLIDFDYELPEELIAQSPAERRDHSRLLMLDKNLGRINHKQFYNLPELLKQGDLLIMNNSKVFPARLYGQKELTGGKVELLLQKQVKDNVWETIGKGLKVGVRIKFLGSALEASVMQKQNDIYEIFFNMNGEKFFQELERIGAIPLPPYIKAVDGKRETDKDRYQTIYAKTRGSVAAPTAGLHFTPDLLDEIGKKGIRTAELTLHVGLGTFQPVKCDNISEHHMHKEYFSVPAETIEMIKQTKARGGRIIAVGTTTTRVLETIFKETISLEDVCSGPISGSTDIFIYPPYQFKIIDGLITNFHLPKSSLLMLISAFAGKDKIDAAYKEAIDKKYRFFSYGDAMLIL